MNTTIDESVSYERGYLKGFHDGRKWKNDDKPRSKINMCKVWNDFCEKHIDTNLPIEEQWQQMKASWSVYMENEPLPLNADWKKTIASALSSTASDLKNHELSIISAMEMLHDLRLWVKMIHLGKLPCKPKVKC